MRIPHHDNDRRPAEVELDLGADYRDLEDLLRESEGRAWAALWPRLERQR